VNFPKWGDDVPFSVVEIKDGQPVAYPNEEINRINPDDLAGSFVSVQSVVVDPLDRLWVLDTGSPLFQLTEYGGPKLVCIDLARNTVVKNIVFPQEVAYPKSYLNDVRFDLRRGKKGMAFITDSSDKGTNGLVVVDLAADKSWRRLNFHPTTKPEELQHFLPVVEGRPFVVPQPDGTIKLGPAMGADGIAISNDGARLYYCPLGSRRLYSVAVSGLIDPTLTDEVVEATVADEGDKGGAADGLESDAAGFVYATNYEHNSISRRNLDGVWETIVHDPRLLWPDTLSLATDGYLYVTANQLHRQARFHGGQDLRRKPYTLFRVRVDAQPVLLH
jgi:sugar lactone lactonase YvrE